MFDIAWSELLLIAVVALIFIGPKELPQVLHTLGRMTAKLRRSADDFRRQFEDSVREAGYEDLTKNLQDLRSLHPASKLKDGLARAINQEYTPKPLAGGGVPATSAPESKPSDEGGTGPLVETKPSEAIPPTQDPAPVATGTSEPEVKSAAADASQNRIAPAA